MSNPDPLDPRPNEQVERFVELLTAQQRRLYVLLVSMVTNASDAQDLLQETNLVLWRRFDDYRPELDFGAWSYQIARNLALKHRERQRRSPNYLQFSDDLLNKIAAYVTSQGDQLHSRATALTDCLQKLSAADRDLVERRAVVGTKVADVAAEVGRPVQGLYKAYQRIYGNLARCIDRALARGHQR